MLNYSWTADPQQSLPAVMRCGSTTGPAWRTASFSCHIEPIESSFALWKALLRALNGFCRSVSVLVASKIRPFSSASVTSVTSAMTTNFSFLTTGSQVVRLEMFCFRYSYNEMMKCKHDNRLTIQVSLGQNWQKIRQEEAV